MKLLSRRRSGDVAPNPGRGLTGPARAAALGMADDPGMTDDPGIDDEPDVIGGSDVASGSAVAGGPSAAGGAATSGGLDIAGGPAAPAPASAGPVMLTLTTRARIEDAEREAALAASQPVRRRLERGAFGGSAPTGGGCSSGGCG
ncbi:conserved hypothetical protein [Frankia canadensis]|uniref:Uncharacterized protein n=1 Tax=Frankia canadensis TaxID=1836972 RepID=A0A2I2KU26_9ACTN|nr:hypothetical protein [Frankia canadensis]SNQ49157.1 conserved hypothetical protein [Frankia canadensis]SOU56447.1 conserved hypothetical protein [Frankia canadensis]